ncbi:MAG: 16S rRNA (cytidine(1402)-2'-O)-methyltransferase, partial [Planktomarina sp.]
MRTHQQNFAPGLYLLATPIGNARDITLRGLDLLEGADVLVAEDTRNLRKFLDIHGIKLNGRPVQSYHDHSSQSDRSRIIDYVAAGKSVAYVSDAGTPLIADPGFHLVRAVQDAGHLVTSLPGPSAVTNALCLAGLPTNEFIFAGFLPPNAEGRKKELV